MAKYSFEFKKKVVDEYLNGQKGSKRIAKAYGLRHSVVERWVINYRQFGEDGLKRKRQPQIYPFEFKLHVVKSYLTSELSYQQLALQVGMTDAGTISRWVNEYRIAGPEALKPKRKGKKLSMDKDRIIQEIEESGSDGQKELLKQLQEENLRLRIENAFLKEARRLRLEEERLLNELRESSTASGETSN